MPKTGNCSSIGKKLCEFWEVYLIIKAVQIFWGAAKRKSLIYTGSNWRNVLVVHCANCKIIPQFNDLYLFWCWHLAVLKVLNLCRCIPRPQLCRVATYKQSHYTPLLFSIYSVLCSIYSLSMHFLFAFSALLPISYALLPAFNCLCASYTNDLGCSDPVVAGYALKLL